MRQDALILAFSALCLAACDAVRLPGLDDEPRAKETEPLILSQTDNGTEQDTASPDVSPQVAATATIDWSRARLDYASRDVAENSNVVSIASGPSAPPVPVLLPDMPVGIASTGAGPTFRPLSDGYYAVYPNERYNMIINGTDRLAGTPTGRASGDSTLRFEQTLIGAQVSFSRYGASYLVEFACKDPDTPREGACISRDDALAEVEALLIAGTR